MGCSTRRSTTMKAAISTAAPTSRLTISVLPQPSSLPRSSASTSRNRELLNVTRPPQSIRSASGSRDSRSLSWVTASAAAPIGTLMKKIHSQPRPSVIAPPTSGPIATATPIEPP